MARPLLDVPFMDSALKTKTLPRSPSDNQRRNADDKPWSSDAATARATELERSAAYVAATSVLELIRTATSTWPTDLAQAARQRAAAMVAAIAQSLDYPPTSAARRRCVRNAIGNAIELSALTDVARAQGLAMAESMQAAGRTMSLLGFAFHATLVPDD